MQKSWEECWPFKSLEKIITWGGPASGAHAFKIAPCPAFHRAHDSEIFKGFRIYEFSGQQNKKLALVSFILRP